MPLQSALWLFFSAQGDQATIDKWLEESLAIFKELGDKQGLAFYCWVKGWVAFKQGDTVMAHDLIERALTLNREIGSRRPYTAALAFLGRIKALQGDFVAAHTLLKESLAEARTLRRLVAGLLSGKIGSCCGNTGRVRLGNTSLEFGRVLTRKMQYPCQAIERTDFEPVMTAARTNSVSRPLSLRGMREGTWRSRKY